MPNDAKYMKLSSLRIGTFVAGDFRPLVCAIVSARCIPRGGVMFNCSRRGYTKNPIDAD